jgi:membrane protein required for beta-lactamase induction
LAGSWHCCFDNCWLVAADCGAHVNCLARLANVGQVEAGAEMKLIDDWKRAYRLFSVQAMALSTAILGTWLVLPDDFKATLPHWIGNAAAIATLIAGVLGRVVQQTPVVPPDDPDATAPGVK